MSNFISNQALKIKVMHKLFPNLRFKIKIKVHCFTLNFINQSYRI
jgi:hypothetical protein